MFRRHLHPSLSGFVLGIAVVAFWALLWVWFFAQVTRTRGETAVPAAAVAARTTA